MKNNERSAEDIIRDIINNPIPNNGILSKPIFNKSKNKQYTFNSNKIKYPVNIQDWNLKNFVDFFSDKYQDILGTTYVKIYRSDLMIFSKISDFFISNGLEKNIWIKKLLNWAFQNKNDIIKREGHFTPNEILKSINYFYQEEVLSNLETGNITRINDFDDNFLINEIKKIDSEGRVTELYEIFGIPITFTYFVKVRGMEYDDVLKITKKRISVLNSDLVKNKNKLHKIFLSSIIGSPYPDNFLCLNWRDIFKEEISVFKNEIWWRERDYKGIPLAKYNSLKQSS